VPMCAHSFFIIAHARTDVKSKNDISFDEPPTSCRASLFFSARRVGATCIYIHKSLRPEQNNICVYLRCAEEKEARAFLRRLLEKCVYIPTRSDYIWCTGKVSPTLMSSALFVRVGATLEKITILSLRPRDVYNAAREGYFILFYTRIILSANWFSRCPYARSRPKTIISAQTLAFALCRCATHGRLRRNALITRRQLIKSKSARNQGEIQCREWNKNQFIKVTRANALKISQQLQNGLNLIN
jgi:hypothetical protein